MAFWLCKSEEEEEAEEEAFLVLPFLLQWHDFQETRIIKSWPSWFFAKNVFGQLFAFLSVFI